MQTKETRTSVKLTDPKLADRIAHLQNREAGLREMTLQVSLLMADLNRDSRAWFDEVIKKYGLDPNYVYAYEQRTKRLVKRYRHTISQRPARI